MVVMVSSMSRSGNYCSESVAVQAAFPDREIIGVSSMPGARPLKRNVRQEA